jgi:hypothetical protein
LDELPAADRHLCEDHMEDCQGPYGEAIKLRATTNNSVLNSALRRMLDTENHDSKESVTEKHQRRGCSASITAAALVATLQQPALSITASPVLLELLR